MISGGGDAEDKFEKSGAKIMMSEKFNHQNRSVKNFLGSVRYLNQFIKKNKIQLVHSHSHYAANIASYARKISPVRTIQTIHGIFPDGGKLKHFNSQYYIAVNDHIKENLLQIKITDPETIFLIYNGVDFSYNSSVSKPGKTIHCCIQTGSRKRS
jgi:hypothetical protein